MRVAGPRSSLGCEPPAPSRARRPTMLRRCYDGLWRRSRHAIVRSHEAVAPMRADRNRTAAVVSCAALSLRRHRVRREAIVSGANSTLIQGARIFDGERVIPLGSVLFRGERIVAVGADIALPSGCEVVPGQGRTLLPGLIDAHTHTPTNPAFALRALRHALTFGVTTTLDMGTDPMTAARMKAHAAVHGDIADLRSAEVVATAPGGHPTELGAVLPTLTAPGQAPGFVADRVAEGSDYLKIILEDGWAYGLTQPCLAYPVLAALVREAHAHRLMAVAHVTRQAMARQALAAGVDVLAHTFVDEPPAPDVVEAIAAAGLVVIPT